MSRHADFLFLNSKAHLLLGRAKNAVSGGAELQVALLARELAGRGFAVSIAHCSPGPGGAVLLDGVECVPAGPFHTGGIADTAKAAPLVFQAIRARRPRFVLVLGWTAWLFLLWLWRPALGFRLVFICGADIEADGRYARENGLRGRLFDFALRRADVVFAMSDRQREMFRQRGIPSLLYRNLVLERPAPRGAVKDIDLLWISRCCEVKRPLEFVRLAAALPEARCVMIAPPEDRKLFERVKDAAASVRNLELIEMVPYDESQAYYDRARIFVNTSVSEGFANSFIQAGLGGAAILSLSVDCDGVLERFKAGATAADDPAALARMAREWLADPEGALAAYAEGAARFVRENHSNDTNVAAFLSGLGLPSHA